MPSLPVLSGREVVGAFAKDGWRVARQRGSHNILVKEGSMAISPFQITKRLLGGRCEA